MGNFVKGVPASMANLNVPSYLNAQIQSRYADVLVKSELLIIDRDEDDFWTRERRYDYYDAPYCRRLFRHDVCNWDVNGSESLLGKGVLDFLTFNGIIWKHSPFYVLLLKFLKKKVHERLYIYQPIMANNNKSDYQNIEELSQIWYTCLKEHYGDIRFPNRHDVLVDLCSDEFLVQRLYHDFDKAGIYPMLQAWESGVPVEDIVI